MTTAAQSSSVRVETYLRMRPLDPKTRMKVKVDYYNIYPSGLPEE